MNCHYRVGFEIPEHGLNAFGRLSMQSEEALRSTNRINKMEIHTIKLIMNKAFTGNITLRYVLALGTLALLSVTAYLTLYKPVTEQKTSAAVVNFSGRQRYLSQSIAINSLHLINSRNEEERKKYRQELLSIAASMEKNHHGLLNGNLSMNLPGNPSPLMRALYFDPPILLDRQVHNYVAATRAFAHDHNKKLVTTNPRLRYILRVSASSLLKSLDTAVQQYQEEGEANSTRLQGLEKTVLGVVLFVLALEAIFIFRQKQRELTLQKEQINMANQIRMSFQAIEQSPVSLIITDIKGKIEYVNPKFTQLTGYTPEEVIGQNPRILKSGKTSPEEYKNLWSTIISGKEWRGELYNKKKNGDFYWEYASVSPIRNADGAVTHFLGIEEDITDRKNIEAQLVHLADRDPLTSLFNRRRFQEELKNWLLQAQRYNTNGALLFLDLDNFKYVNDTLGHQVGDELLLNIANMLQKRLRETDIIARLGGDEFAILLSHVDADRAQSIALQIIESIRHHDTMIGGQSASVTVSIGIALFPQHGNELETLLTHADLAMYRAKEQGRNRACVYTPSQKTMIESRMTWEKRIRHALCHDRFVLHLQPIVDMPQKSVVGYEALLRMVEENGELVYPSNFLDVAEHFGLINEIDRWVVRKAINLIAEIQKTGKNQYIGVNISGKAFADKLLLPLIRQEMKKTAIDPVNLVLEITETSIIANLTEAQHFITSLKNIGCRFALDDFGTGFSSFNYLKHLPIDYLKIDGGFIRNLPNDLTDQHLVKAIVEMARGLGKQTVAEFVECERTVQLLTDHGVNFAQGYHIGMPNGVLET